jgi:flagellar biosynthesis protein FliQ
MGSADVYAIFHDSVLVMLKLSLPLLMIALIVGVTVSILQALTQIQEQTLTFVPKLVAIFLGSLVFLPLVGGSLMIFTLELYARISHMGTS